MGDAGSHHFPKSSLQVHRLRGRIGRTLSCLLVAMGNGADHARLVARLPEYRFHEIGETGLAVGARNPDQHQFQGGVPKEAGRHLCHGPSKVRGFNHHGFFDRRRSFWNHHGPRASLEGLANKVPPVQLLPGERKEQRPRRHLTGVVGNVGDLHHGVSLHPDSVQTADECFQVHLPSAFFSNRLARTPVKPDSRST